MGVVSSPFSGCPLLEETPKGTPGATSEVSDFLFGFPAVDESGIWLLAPRHAKDDVGLSDHQLVTKRFTSHLDYLNYHSTKDFQK
jgi:hypothetical protein